MSNFARLLPVVALLASATAAPRSGALLRDGFELPQTRWTDPEGHGSFRLERHEITRAEVHSGLASEALVVGASNGPVYVGYPLQSARVIDELAARVWVKANRPGPQLFARVVLPQSRDASGNPIVTLLPGSQYTNAGTWQALELNRLPALLEQAGRGLRAMHGPHVDLREAVIDRLVLNVAAGPGVTAVWVDDLQVTGLVEAGNLSAPTSRPTFAGAAFRPGASEPMSGERVPRIRLNGNNLLVGDVPILLRAIVHRGESLEWLRNLGFNAVSLATPPTPEIAADAERLGLWLLSPIPAPADDESQGVNPPPVLGRLYDRVLAWNLGGGFWSHDLDEVKRRAESIRVRDRELARPLFCEAVTDLRSFSRDIDILLLTRLPIGSSLELPKYLTWLRDRPRLARPGTPIWATIQTEPLDELAEQWRQLSAGRVSAVPLQAEQIDLLAHLALAGGARGLIFESRSRLDEPTPMARLRTKALQLVNLELSLAEPWAASGNFMTMIPGSDPEALAAVFESSQSRLLMPLWSGKGVQYVPGQLAGSNVSFVVPGLPESFNAYELTPADVPIPRLKRIPGGTRVTLDELGLSSIVLLTADPASVQYVSRRVAAMSQQAARLKRELAAARLELVTDVDRRLATQFKPFSKANEYLSLARGGLLECDAQLAAGQYQAAFLSAERALRPLRLVERAHWEAVTKGLPSPAVSPFAATFATLPEHLAFFSKLSGLQFVSAGLLGGDFEQVSTSQQMGWQHVRYAEPGIKSGAELSPRDPRFGRFSLRLWAQPTDPTEPPPLVETPPVWIESPGIEVTAGELLRIRGWVRVGPVAGSVDGLLIFDSTGGLPLAERIENTDGWKAFTIYRVATESGPLNLKFALTGLGEAWIDEVAIDRLMRPTDLIRPPLLGPGPNALSRQSPVATTVGGRSWSLPAGGPESLSRR